ncbi:hypothetical protein EJB05_32456, partial [Eragrostis curvula]
PGRRFSIPRCYNPPAETLDGWLQSPALKNLQELEFCYDFPFHDISLPLPLRASVHNFSSTLRVASFGGCSGFPDGNSAGMLHLPVLKQLSLLYVTISNSSMQTLFDGCPVIESLLINCPKGCSCVQVVSHSLRSLGLRRGSGVLRLKQLIIKDAPNLQRLLLLVLTYVDVEIDISLISAPKLEILGQITDTFPRIQFAATFFQGSQQLSSMMVVPNVKVLALTNGHLNLDMVINFMRCFPCLETLYIKIMMIGNTTNSWCRKYRNLISTLDIHLKKIVLLNYRGNRSHVNFAKFFVLNAKVLQLMILELQDRNTSSEWIERQHRLIKTNNRASIGARFDFVYHDRLTYPFGHVCTKALCWFARQYYVGGVNGCDTDSFVC